MQVTRRGVIAGAAAGGGLLLAWTLMPRAYPTPLVPARGGSKGLPPPPEKLVLDTEGVLKLGEVLAQSYIGNP